MMAFEHRAIRPNPKAVALPRLQGSDQVFGSHALELSEFDPVQRFVGVKGPQGRLSHFQPLVYAGGSARPARPNYGTLMPMDPHTFLPAERAVFRRLTSPEKIQRFLDELVYNKEVGGETCRSPRRVMRDRTAHCMEGALFGAAALEMLGHAPLLLDFEAVRDDDHVLAIFRERGHWGALAKSNYTGLRYREPVYRTLRELAMSYFEHYHNLRREKTLRNYSRPVNLRRFDAIQWMTAEEDLWTVPEYLVTIRHTPLLRAGLRTRLGRVDDRLFAAGLVGLKK
jgi:hypothetical protein